MDGVGVAVVRKAGSAALRRAVANVTLRKIGRATILPPLSVSYLLLVERITDIVVGRGRRAALSCKA